MHNVKRTKGSCSSAAVVPFMPGTKRPSGAPSFAETKKLFLGAAGARRGATVDPGPPTADTVYEPVGCWAKIPHGLFLREATSVAVDADDRVYVFSRGNCPVMVFDPDGNVVDAWGTEDPFTGTAEHDGDMCVGARPSPSSTMPPRRARPAPLPLPRPR